VIGGILLLAGATMVLIANPFVDSMKNVAGSFGIREFYFVQWVAPFLTEFPEKVTAFYWAKRITRAPVALLNMVSSKVNQWTLLASMIPFVYEFSEWRHGLPVEGVPIDEKIAPELWLSLAMTMYGAATLLKRRFTGANCAVLFTLWFVQFVNPDAEHGFVHAFDMRRLTTWIFAGLVPVELLMSARTATPLQDLKETWRLMRKKPDHQPEREAPPS
jgi:cation:H+ antiporter